MMYGQCWDPATCPHAASAFLETKISTNVKPTTEMNTKISTETWMQRPVARGEALLTMAGLMIFVALITFSGKYRSRGLASAPLLA